jgi:hypothetical protein
VSGPVGLWAMLWGDAGQYHEVRVGAATCWVPCEKPRALCRLLAMDDVYVSAVPRTAKDCFALGKAWVVWARLESPECADRLAKLPTGPSLVVREGGSSRRWALWALCEPLEGDWITRATERLAHAVKGRRGAADASALIASPFSRLTAGRSRPSKLYVEYESATRATARQIVGRLPDAPALHDWRAQRDAA